MKDKKCSNCEEGRIDSKKSKSGLCSKCLGKKWKEEHKEEVDIYAEKYRKKYYKENKEKITKTILKYRQDNKEKVKKFKRRQYDENIDYYKGKSKEHYENNKELRKKQNLEYYHRRYKIDEGFRIRRLLGTALGYVIRHYIKTGKVANPMKKYYIDWEGIMKVLTPIPKPRNKYHVDHIIPLWKFDLSNFEQIHLAFAPENHRWMLAGDNMRRDKSKRTSGTC